MDIDESTLDRVPSAQISVSADRAQHANSAAAAANAQNSAQLAGLGPGELVTGRSASATPINCGTTEAYQDCVSVEITLSHPARLLLIGSGEWISTTSPGQGECVLEVDDNGTVLGRRQFGEIMTEPSDPGSLATTAITDPVAVGDHQVDLSCRELDQNVAVLGADLSVVAIGSA